MRRDDDFAERRKHIADLTDEELYNRFWELVDQVVDPLLELGKKNTTPSVERAVLLRMGVSARRRYKYQPPYDADLRNIQSGHPNSQSLGGRYPTQHFPLNRCQSDGYAPSSSQASR